MGDGSAITSDISASLLSAGNGVNVDGTTEADRVDDPQ